MPVKKKKAESKAKSKGKRHHRRPRPQATLWPILISPGGTVPLSNQFMQIGSYDSISFRNTAGFAVNVVFTNAFPELANLPDGATSGAQGGANSLNLTLNFKIENNATGKTTGGPYAVQFGIGPLPITISAFNTNPDPIAVPKGGQIQFTNNDGVTYPITWSLPGVWSPQPSTVAPGQNRQQKALAGATGKGLTYTLSPSNILTRGGGTVTIGS
jgi:hypothetical protein